MEEGDGDERVDGVGDELLLGECELVILKLILVQEVGDHGCEMWPCFPFRKRKPWHEQRGRSEVGDRGEGEGEGQGGNKIYFFFTTGGPWSCSLAPFFQFSWLFSF